MTGFEFRESLTFSLPDVKEDLNLFSGKDFAESHGLVVDIAAIHEGLTKNFTFYSEEELTKSLQSWTTPYPRPIIVNHDVYTNPLGRVMGARMAKEGDGSPYINLQVAIKDVEAIGKIADQRFLTGSVGGSAGEALCSVCGIDWALQENFAKGRPCKHERGKVYGGTVASIQMKNISWREYSFVNVPADSKSIIKSVNATEMEDIDVQGEMKFILFDLNDQLVFQLSEAEERVDMLAGMKRKEAQPMYLGLKGTYLSVTALDENINENIDINDTTDTNYEEAVKNLQESSMPKQVSQDLEDAGEDILTVVETLQKEEKVQDSEITEQDLSEDLDNEESSEQDETVEHLDEEETDDTDNAVVEEDSDEVEEDVDTVSDGKEDEITEDEDVTESEEVSEEEEVEAIEQEADESELTESIDDIDEQPIDELNALVETLQEENLRLKQVVKFNLVEKVVDAKIAVGLYSKDDREEAIAEHMDRTPSSLADSLRDLATMSPGAPAQGDEVMETSLGLEDENSVFVDVEEDDDTDPIEALEDLFVDVLMARKSI